MHIAEVKVFDANATALDIQTADLMEAAGQALASETARIAETLGGEHREIWVLCGPGMRSMEMYQDRGKAWWIHTSFRR